MNDLDLNTLTSVNVNQGAINRLETQMKTQEEAYSKTFERLSTMKDLQASKNMLAQNSTLLLRVTEDLSHGWLQ